MTPEQLLRRGQIIYLKFVQFFERGVHTAPERERGGSHPGLHPVDVPKFVQLRADQIIAELGRGKGEHG
jgi:hypothetical protein